MFRSQYDNDTTVWSPEGRIHQIEYAMEAVKQGTACIGLKSKTHAVLVGLKRETDLSSHQQKILVIDDHCAIAISGLRADGQHLCKFMRIECLNSKFSFDEPLQIGELVSRVGEKSQVNTQRYGRRPYGVGLLVCGYDSKGPHIYQTCPSANYYVAKAMAIGARSQSARTYLEKNLDKLPDCSLNDLVKHGLRALSETLGNDKESPVTLKEENVSIAIVGKDHLLEVCDTATLTRYINTKDEEFEYAALGGDERPIEAMET